MSDQQRFDKAYYRQFYAFPRGRADDRKECAIAADFISAYLHHMAQPVRRILDLGCGLGYWREAMAEVYPRASYQGVEHSEFLCNEYGWTRGSVVDFRSRKPFDLIICHDVVQYLSGTDARDAIDNLAALCRGALYFNVLTKEDWEHNCDRKYTDGNVFLRRADWYRRQLKRHFRNAGGCLFVKNESSAFLWELASL